MISKRKTSLITVLEAIMINLDIARQRLHNQLITRSMFEKPEDVVQWLGAVQAKEYSDFVISM
jgi:hypothetical protein